MDFNISYAMSRLPATWKSQGILKLFQDQYKRLIIFQDGQGKFEIIKKSEIFYTFCFGSRFYGFKSGD